jgi:uncharacterized membrane protein
MLLRKSLVRPLLGFHPGAILAVLDATGLAIAAYLASVELAGELPYCGPLHGCEQVAQSEYSRINGIPVAVFGVILSVILLSLALAWWRSNYYGLLLAHYGLSLAGVIFEVYFLYTQVFVIRAVCIWCTSYGLTLVARFVIALAVYLRQPRPGTAGAADLDADEAVLDDGFEADGA